MNKEKYQRFHSSEYFGRYRDLLWNNDFLDLMCQRWKLQDASSLLDVGCGLGHWSRCLLPYLNSKTKVTGIDREEGWVEQAKTIFSQIVPSLSSERYEFIQGDIYKLPFEDESFDVVTCQTLLIHLADPLKGLSEMLRVLRRDGILICIEPENIINTLSMSSLTYQYPMSLIVKSFSFWLCYEQGKIVLGEGNNSIGGMIPGFFSKLGLADIKVYTSDKSSPMFPPYQEIEQAIIIEQDKAWYRDSTGPYDFHQAKRYCMAGGYSEDEFNESWEIIKQMYDDYHSEINSLSLYAGGGRVLYLISGRKV